MGELDYLFWRLDMWTNDYGSYNDIEWAVSKRLLTPGKKPGKLQGRFIKFVIRKCSPFRDRQQE